MPDPVIEPEVEEAPARSPRRTSSRRTCSSRTSRSTGCAASTDADGLRPRARPGRWTDVALRPERFGALAYHFGTRRLSFLRRRSQASVAAQRRVRARARRADLPHLGADVRVQPRVRALPVLVRPARPARAHHRRVQSRDRRARAHAGLLREHRRRRADGAQGLLGARRVRDRASRGREVLHQRVADRRRSGPRGCAASDYVDVQISLDGATAEVNDRVRGAGSYATAMRAMELLARHGLQAQRRRHARERRPARRVQGDRRRLRRARCGSRGCGRPAAAPTCGTSCTPRRSSSARSTSGCSRTARTC